MFISAIKLDVFNLSSKCDGGSILDSNEGMRLGASLGEEWRGVLLGKSRILTFDRLLHRSRSFVPQDVGVVSLRFLGR